MVLVVKEEMGADFCSFCFLFFHIFPWISYWQSVTTCDQIIGTGRKKGRKGKLTICKSMYFFSKKRKKTQHL